VPGRPGELGERAAEKELKRLRMTLLERNLRSAGAEIDLVALDGKTIVFVEVKSRAGNARVGPVEAVDGEKQRHVIRGARAFLRRKGLTGQPRRYDIAAVRLADDGRPVSVKWVKAAFDEGQCD
jgi:putative endonuclease